MNYMGDREYWDNKFSMRSDQLFEPEKSLVENISYLKKGSILDVACGDGRNALFLLKYGFKVTGVDFSDKALERLQMFAKKEQYMVDTKQIDLSVSNSLSNIGLYDNVLINHYRLHTEQFMDMKNHITENGILFICGFGYQHKVDTKIRQEDLIRSRDFEGLEHSFDLIKYIENSDDIGFFVTYIFRKKSLR